MKKTLSLPNLDLLDYLSKDEKDFLNEILRETSQINYARLVGAINFYLSHQIAYNKFKHGLSFVPSIPSTMKNSKNAYAIALHHSKNSPPHKANLLIAKESFFQKEYDCYNTAGIMRVNEKTLQKYLAISESIDDFAQFITQNNCIACENCEQDFLPLKVLKDKKNVEPWLYLYPPTKERIKKIYEIYRKAMPHIFVVTKRQGKYEFNFSKEVGEQIEKHLDHIGMAVAWFENR